MKCAVTLDGQSGAWRTNEKDLVVLQVSESHKEVLEPEARSCRLADTNDLQALRMLGVCDAVLRPAGTERNAACFSVEKTLAEAPGLGRSLGQQPRDFLLEVTGERTSLLARSLARSLCIGPAHLATAGSES